MQYWIYIRQLFFPSKQQENEKDQKLARAIHLKQKKERERERETILFKIEK